MSSEPLEVALARLARYGGRIVVAPAVASARLVIERNPAEAALTSWIEIRQPIDTTIIDALGTAGWPPLGPPPAPGMPDRRRDAAIARAAQGRSRFERTWLIDRDALVDIEADIRAAITAIEGAAPGRLMVDTTWVLGSSGGND